ncbi:peptidase family m20 m25 m40 protein [Colletotrichum karsti]|uniref:Eukaryotic translation initiation factor 3 subunit G n=1 Tax=Colletotrichum karsti TaxID=1095194 RepID=A0A9P6LCX9_9PEZI|nr:peptidase family m20 m25 m40 protein [Colletotrichum karsti]KAF9870074.1 peptidase family m20 m25 m40 protein [Colletotrichum karsti]
MADVEPSSPNAATFAETLQYRATQSRRSRPPDLEAASGEQRRVPLRAENRLSRRDSRLGLRSIFGRNKSSREIDTTTSYFDTGRPSSIRASLAEISNWPYMRSETTLPSAASRPTSVATHAPFSDSSIQRRPTTTERSRSQTPGAKSSRGNLATWDPPPLFQAYPQAIKHAQLPACTTSADVILRFHDRKGSISLRDDLTQLGSPQELSDDQFGDRAAEKARKKHLRTMSTARLEWTSKIYVLCTSGYLLQYSGEGNFDRLPEKMLHLGKDSAAFVSDAIPGRHWVLQVSSAMESNGMSAADSRSLLSRLPFRAADKRHAANFLMVFNSAEEMESWITILRREIEALGGKKNLSETGKPKADDNVVQLKAQPSQRTLVVRDPERFSRVLPPDFCLHLEQARLHDPDHPSAVDADMTREPSIDDISTTNSVMSHDDRQLESLRDSTNRLSCISSGQRTFMTSAGSSPACSPVRDSFASSYMDDLPPSSQEAPTVRPRPNAAAILDRRQSLQTSGYLELRSSPMSRPQSNMYSEHEMAQITANFSVPISRRYSAMKSPTASPEQVRNRDSFSSIRSARKPPPTALAMARPLSIVADQPSPPVNGLVDAVTGQRSAVPSEAAAAAFPPRQASLGPREHAATVTVRSPRKHASSPSLTNLEEVPLSPELRTFILPSRTPPTPLASEMQESPYSPSANECGRLQSPRFTPRRPSTFFDASSPLSAISGSPEGEDTIAPMVAHDWADDEDVDETSTDLPAPQTISNKDGSKTIITFRYNDQGQKVKTTRRIRFTTHTEKVNPRVAERKTWSKFGLSEKDGAGPAADTTSVGENIIFRPSTNWRKDEKEQGEDPNAQAMKDKLKDKKVKCRICNGEHFTARCPYKDTMAPVGAESGTADVAAGMGDEAAAAAAAGPGAKKGSYVPPALRAGAAGAAAGDRMGGSKYGERDDLATLRVTNVSELAEEQELRDMFERFGRVTRVFLAKDRETGLAKGFAFISFADRSDAVKAAAKMDGFGFKHLILRVEFAKKAN